jgi:hypothetical protein
VRKLVLSILMSLIILMIGSLFFISYARAPFPFDNIKSASGFLSPNLPNYLNTIPNEYRSRYFDFLGVSDLINANITLPSINNHNNIYPFNSFNNSLLNEAVAYIRNNNQEEIVPNAWFIRNQGTWYSLGFANIVSDFNFSQPNVTNPGNNYNAIMLWDPTLTPNYGIGITYDRTINLIKKNGNIVVVLLITSFNNINHNFNAATIGDFNNDNIPDIFVIGSNEPNTGYAKIKGAYSISGRRDAAGNLNFNPANTITTLNIRDSWDNVYVQWTCDAVKSRAWISQNGSLTKVPIDFNNDGKEDLIIAGADGNIWYVPNTTTNRGSSTITFGNPIKILDYDQTGMKTGINGSGTNGNIVIDVGDIDNDGSLDLVAATTDGAEIKIFKGNPNFNPNSNINNTNNSPFLADQQGVINLYSTRSQGNNYYSERQSAVETPMEYRGLSTQRDQSGNNPPNADYVGAANNITLVDFNRDGELDIAVTTDNWNFKPSDINNNYKIKFTDRDNLTLSSPGGRIYTFINNSSIQGNNLNIKFKGYFLGQYAISQDGNGNWFADFDGLSIMNLSNPSAFDIVATDGNHARTLFSFEQLGNMFVYADKFILTSKDLIIDQGNEQDAYNFNRYRFYIKQATITIKGSIIGNNNGLNMIVYAANDINNNNPKWVETNSIPLNSALSGGELIVDFDFYPNSNNVLYRINNGPWQSTNIRRNKGSSLVYRIEIIPTRNKDYKTTDLMGNNIRCLSDNINITGIDVTYIASSKTIRISNWKEVR